MSLRQAAQQALEAWFRPHGINYVDFKPYMEALKQALAEPEQEPVAWVVYDTDNNDIAWSETGKRLKAETPLYTAPTPRKPLTDYINAAGINGADSPHMVVEKLQSAIERAHGIGGGE